MSLQLDRSIEQVGFAAEILVNAPTEPKLAVGTVQFGLPYGFARPARAVRASEVRAILGFAWKNGIDMLDTAADYGDAENVIAAVRPPEARFRIVSKTTSNARANGAPVDVDRVAARVRQSLEHLHVESLDALLVHHAEDLLAPNGHRLYAILATLKSEALVRRIGVSVYDPETLRRILDHYDIDVVQLPLNMLDQRFLHDGVLDDLAERHVEVHARSVFLQGVLLADGDRLPVHFDRLRAHLAKLHADVEEAGLTPAAAALNFVKGCRQVNRVLIGVDSLSNLKDNVRAFQASAATTLDFGKYAIEDREMIDPRRW